MTNYTVLNYENLNNNTIAVNVLINHTKYFVENTEVTLEVYNSSNRNKGTSNFQSEEEFEITSPYSEEKIQNKVNEFLKEIPNDTIEYPIGSQETMNIDDIERQFYFCETAPESVISIMNEKFPEVNLNDIGLISSPAYHNIVGENIISCFLKDDLPNGFVVNGVNVVSRSRKFCLNSCKCFDKCYKAIENETFNFMPEFAEILGVSYQTNIQEGLTIPDFYDIYFWGDPELIENYFNLPIKRGSYDTYYSVTVLNNEVIRKKQYCYDEEASVFSNWKAKLQLTQNN